MQPSYKEVHKWLAMLGHMIDAHCPTAANPLCHALWMPLTCAETQRGTFS